jgi:putative phosphoesterase
MRILVVSDNHYDEGVLQEVLLKEKNIDLYLHAGDSEMSEAALRPFISVKGNNDYLINVPFRIINTTFYNIYLTHGHLERNYKTLVTRAKYHDCKIVIHGHTHRSSFKKVDDVFIVCPGALNYPRGGESRRYAIIEIDDENGRVDVKFFDLL